MIDLQLGNAEAVIESLEPMLDSSRLSRQDDATLIMAYQLAGKTEQAADHVQISMYLHLLALVSASVQYLTVSGGRPEGLRGNHPPHRRVAEAVPAGAAHPNVMAQFHYQAALLMTAFGAARTGACTAERLRESRAQPAWRGAASCCTGTTTFTASTRGLTPSRWAQTRPETKRSSGRAFCKA